MRVRKFGYAAIDVIPSSLWNRIVVLRESADEVTGVRAKLPLRCETAAAPRSNPGEISKPETLSRGSKLRP